MNEYYESLTNNKEALIKCLQERCTSAAKFLGMVSSNAFSDSEKDLADKISLLRIAIDELRNGSKEPVEVISSFEDLARRESEELKNSLKGIRAGNKKGLQKQPSIKIISKSKIRVA